MRHLTTVALMFTLVSQAYMHNRPLKNTPAPAA